MIYLQWLIVVFIVLVALIAWYFQNKIQNNLKEFDVSNSVFSSWILKSENLNNEGKLYRKRIFICWVTVFISALVYFSIS